MTILWRFKARVRNIAFGYAATEIMDFSSFGWSTYVERVPRNVFHNEYCWKFYVWRVLAHWGIRQQDWSCVPWDYAKNRASVARTVVRITWRCVGWMPLSQFVAIFFLEDVALLLYTLFILKNSQFFFITENAIEFKNGCGQGRTNEPARFFRAWANAGVMLDQCCHNTEHTIDYITLICNKLNKIICNINRICKKNSAWYVITTEFQPAL